MERSIIIDKSGSSTSEYISLTMLAHYSDIEYKNFKLIEKYNWKLVAKEMIEHVILQLLICKAIEIKFYKEKRKYLFGLSSYIREGYVCSNRSNFETTDVLFINFLKAIDWTFQNYKRRSNLSKVIDKFLEYRLGEGEKFSKPQKEFVIKSLEYVSRQKSWLQHNSKSIFLEILKDHRIVVQAPQKSAIKSEYSKLRVAFIHEVKTNLMFRKLSMDLPSIIEKEFLKKEPSDSGTGA